MKQDLSRNQEEPYDSMHDPRLPMTRHHDHDSPPVSDLDRRTFLSLMGASISLATFAGCRRPEERIVPYVSKPEEITPGIPQYYATSMPLGTENLGVLVETHEGRPTRVAGQLHGTGIWATASILNLYDPDRSQQFLDHGKASTREAFAAFWSTQYAGFLASKGEGLAVLSESYASPTLDRLKKEFLAVFPNAFFATYEPVSDENILKATEIAFGTPLVPVYDLRRTDVILSLDADFLGTESSMVQNTLGFVSRRTMLSEQKPMNRLYLVESRLSQTAAMADHRIALQSRLIGAYLSALAKELRYQGLELAVNEGDDWLLADEKKIDRAMWEHLKNTPEDRSRPFTVHMEDWKVIETKWVKTVAKDLLANKGRSLIIVGRNQPPRVHALAIAINEALGLSSGIVSYWSLPHSSRSSTDSLRELVQHISQKKITALAILGGNPVYNAPADLGFGSALADVPMVVHLSPWRDETSERATWHVPMRHYLESWGDVCDFAQWGVIQPVIAPMYDGMNMAEMLSLLATGKDAKDYDLVRTTWKAMIGEDEGAWRNTLHHGMFLHPDPDAGTARWNVSALSEFIAKNPSPPEVSSTASFEVIFTLPPVHDGRFANNGWLQEFPDPVTKITWDNVAMMSQATADTLGIQSKDLVRVSVGARDIGLPAWIVPGMAPGTVAIALGYGRTAAGRVGNNVGTNAYRLRTSDAPYIATGATLARIRGTADIACVQDHHGLDREAMAREGVQKRLPQIFREATLDEYRKHPEFAKERVEMPRLRSLWDEHAYTQGSQWGMSIDLNACTGCGACAIACQSENNIPIVGKKQVLNGREMHWMRVDRYYSGTEDEPNVHVQPVACMQCEMAPCEQVCPVAATSHDEEGLNGMTYNRCIGTRYCSNNCPYKARRFNFFNYTSELPETIRLAQNPEVTVRFRGVMEKCTFCVQRISRTRIVAKREGRGISDGEIKTACEESCPAQAIVFGNINDPKSRIAELKKNNRDYALLGELNLRPRLTYLAKLRNPNPEMGNGG